MPTPEIFLHGFLSGPALWDPLFEQLEAACGRSQRVALSLPYHSAQEGLAPATSFADCCVQLWHRVDARLGTKPDAPASVHLVGYSLGGRLALSMACQRPHRVASLTLIGVHPGLTCAKDKEARRAADGAWVERLRGEPLAQVLRAWDAQALFAPRHLLGAQAQAALKTARLGLAGDDLAAGLQVLGLAEMADMRPLLPHLTMPMHLVAGAKDTKFLALAHAMQAQAPNAQAWPIACGHHDVVLTHPQEVAKVCLTAFGRGSSPG